MASLPLLDVMECNECNNALGQNLILKLVLEHVGQTDIDDLLECRLVSHSWNRVAVQLLEQQHDYVLKLDYEKLQTIKSLLWNSKMSRTSNSEGEELESLRLSLTLLPRECSEDCSELAGCAYLLELHPHLRLAFLVIDYDSVQVKEGEHIQHNQRSWHSLANLELFTLLKLASTDLVKLVVESWDKLTPPHFENFEFNSYLHLEFPRLTSLAYKAGEPITTECELLDLANHMVHIIKQAPKLMKLHLDVLNELDSTHSTRSFLECCSANLQKLTLFLNEKGITKLLREIKFPKLRVFKAEDVFSTGTLNQVVLFVLLNCPALTHIHINLDQDFELNKSLLNLDLLPNLPNITDFEMRSFYNTSPEFTEFIRTFFCQVFPKLMPLNILSIDFDIFFMFGTHLMESGHLAPPPGQYPVFTTISTLEIQIPVVQPEMFDVMDMATSIYHHTFPNLKTLIISPCTSLDESYLDRIFKFLCFHPGIQNLIIFKYARHWLNQPSILNQGFSGLKSLRLHGSSKENEGVHLNIIELLIRFPAVEYLQLGKACVSTTEIQRLREMIKQFDFDLLL